MSIRRRRASPAIAVAVLLLTAAACQSSTDDAAPVATGEAPLSGLLGTDAFADYVADHPDVPLVNVHVPYEGHLAGTDDFVHFEEIGEWAGLPADRDAPIALYCRSGNMSGQAAAELADLGYTNVVDLEGGMNAWSASGRPLLDDPPAD